MKKIFTLLFAIIANVCMIQASVITGICGNNLSWSYDDVTKTLEITGSGDMSTFSTGQVFSGWSEFAGDVKKIIIPPGLTGVGSNTFGGCVNVKELIWSARRAESKFYPNPFRHCYDSLSIVRLEGDIEYLSDYFFSCKNIDTLEISAKIDTIGKQLFTLSNSLKVVNIKSSISDWCQTEILESLSSPLDKAQTSLFAGKQLVILNIPDSITRIGRSVFCHLPSLTKVTIGDEVKSIGWGAFSGCENLTTVIMSDKTEIIEKSVFSGCISLKNINISNNLRFIGNAAFSGCSKIQNISLPESVIEMESGIFSGCTSLISIHLPSNIKNIPESFVYGCSNLTTINIPEKVTQIGKNAFYDCKNLANITLPDSIRKIGTWAFFNTKLTQISIPLQTDTIETNAFRNLKLGTVYWNAKNCHEPSNTLHYENYGTYTGAQIHNFYLGDEVECIPSRLLWNNANIHSITIPKSVRHIEAYAFRCSEINNVRWKSKNCTTFATAEDAPFYMSRDNITSFEFSNDVDSIPSYLCYGMSSVENMVIPDSVKFVGDFAFSLCSTLNKITIGKSVSQIGEYAFMSCENMTEITCKAQTPPIISEFTFEEVPLDVILRVPCNSIEMYQEAPYWNKFTNYQVISPDELFSVDIVSADENQGHVEHNYDGCSVTIQAIPYEGYEFTMWSDGISENPRTITILQDTAMFAIFNAIGTSIEDINDMPNTRPYKVFRDGQIYIIRDDKTYTMITGAEVK